MKRTTPAVPRDRLFAIYSNHSGQYRVYKTFDDLDDCRTFARMMRDHYPEFDTFIYRMDKLPS